MLPALAAPAREWLRGEGCDMAVWLGLPREQVTGWVSDLPGLVQEALPGL